MGFKHLALLTLIGTASVALGCGSDGNGTGGTGATGGSGGTAATGGNGGGGGTGGTDTDDPCFGQPACIVCPKEALPPDIAPLLPDGIRTPVEYTATPEAEVVQGGTVAIAVDAEIIVTLPISAEGAINEGSTSSYVASAGGEGTLIVPIPEQELSGQSLLIDGGSGSTEFAIDADASALVVELDSVLVNLTVSAPVELDLILDASEDGDCFVEGEGITIAVTESE